MEVILSTAKGSSSTGLFQNKSIISSRCSGYWPEYVSTEWGTCNALKEAI